MNELRIRSLVLFLGAAFAVLVVGLSGIAVFDHDLWRARASDNALSFDSVWPRRATIRGRDGSVLAVDVPSYDIELTYREFRRRHPVAAAVHGANLSDSAFGAVSWDMDEAYGFDRREAILAAGRVMSRLDLAVLGRSKLDEDLLERLPRYRPTGSVDQDLRFYLASMLSGLTDRSWTSWSLAISERQEAAGPITHSLRRELAEAFDMRGASGEECRVELLRRFEERVAEFEELAGLLDELHAAERLRRGREPLKNPWRFVEVLEDARKSAENQADARALSERVQRYVEIGDFWRWLAHQRREYSTVRDWLRSDEELRRTDARDFEEAREQAAKALAKHIERSSDALKGEARDLKIREHLGRFFDEVEGFEAPRLRDEHQQRVIVRRVLFDDAVTLETRYARHLGLSVRPSVERRVELELGGIGPYIGKVSRLSFEDQIDWDREGDPTAADGFVEDVTRFQVSAPSRGGGPVNEDADFLFYRELDAHVWSQAMQGLRIGRSGVERSMNERLSGVSGLRVINRNRLGHELSMDDMVGVESGDSVTLTIEPGIQEIADSITSRLGEASQRALVVIDPQTGDILALSGHGLNFVPDPDEIDEDGPDEDENELWNIEGYDIDGTGFDLAATWPRTDPSIGSVIKPFVALEYLTALGDGRYRVQPTDFEVCGDPGSRYREVMEGRRFGCSHPHGTASHDVVHALARSCNIFFYEVWRRADGFDKLAAGRRSTDRSGVDPIGELVAARLNWREGRSRGLVPGLDSRLQVTPRELHPSGGKGRGPMVRTIGYDWCVSALDVAHAYAMLATGRRVPLGLVQERDRAAPSAGWSDEHLDLVYQGLQGCVRYGTASKWSGRIQRLGLLEDAFAKTGTAFILKKSMSDQDYKRDFHNSWFAFVLGTRSQSRLVVVASAYLVEGYGAAEAGPMVMDLLEGMSRDEDLRTLYLDRK